MVLDHINAQPFLKPNKALVLKPSLKTKPILKPTPTLTGKEEEKSYSVEKIREIYPNAYKPWKEEEDKKLLQFKLTGKPVGEIAIMMGRKKGAINSRLEKI